MKGGREGGNGGRERVEGWREGMEGESGGRGWREGMGEGGGKSCSQYFELFSSC